MSETKRGLERVINLLINTVLLMAWVVVIAVCKHYSDDDFVWGYSCSHSSDINEYVTFASICTREVSRPKDLN